MGLPVVDEYYERYRRLSHDELYRQLRAGTPTQVEGLAASWRRTEDALRALATTLRRDLDALARFWVGVGSDEYQRRLTIVAAWAEALLDEAVAIRTGLSLMSSMLADTQSRAEPDAPAAEDWAADGLLGPALGHTGTAADRARAQERIARLVAELAAGYAVADHRVWPSAAPEVPQGLPGTGVHHQHHQHGPPDRLRDRGTRLAGHVHGHIPPLATVSTVDVPIATAPTAPAAAALSTVVPPPPTTLPAHVAKPAGSGLAAAPAAGHLVGHTQASGTAEPGSAGGAPPPSMMGGGGTAVVGAPPATVAGYHRPFDDMSWAAGEHQLWVDGTDDPPPAVLGDQV